MPIETQPPTKFWFADFDSADVVEVEGYQRTDTSYWVPDYGVSTSFGIRLFFDRQKAVDVVVEEMTQRVMRYEKLLAKAKQL